MFHTPTFHYRLYRNQVSPLLLHAMYAFAAPLCSNASFIAAFPSSTPPHVRSIPFCSVAENLAGRVISSSNSTLDDGRLTWDDVESIQALHLLAVIVEITRSADDAKSLHETALRNIEGMLPIASSSHPANFAWSEWETLLECRNRIFWFIVINSACTTAGQGLRLDDSLLRNVAAPRSEIIWQRNGASDGAHQMSERRLQEEATPRHQHAGASELGYLARIVGPSMVIA